MDRGRAPRAGEVRLADVIRVCFHGAESTGKSVLAAKLANDWGCPLVGEFGRGYCETHGTDLTMADLLAIAAGQDAAMRGACAGSPPLVLLDTDPLMTAAWTQMLFGEMPAALFAYPQAEHYLLFAPDVPWLADGTRFFGTVEARARFAASAEDVLERAGVSFTRIGGNWDEREQAVRNAVAAL
jgi:NadR type nicotinamide-nucleotide adenylyltransferase